MNKRVELSPRAKEELRTATRWWAENRSAEQARRWLSRALRVIRLLRSNAHRCPLSSENGIVPFEIRDRTFGLGGRPSHRIVFTIRPDNSVYVLTVRYLGQDRLKAEDIE